MFEDKAFQPKGFQSVITKETAKISNATQTIEIAMNCQGVQNLELKDSTTQTLNIESQISTVDYDKLAEFLRRITPNILEALDEPSSLTETTVGVTSLKHPARLLSKFSTLDESNPEKKISVLNWSTNGGTLAIAYSALSHKTWCDHLSKIKLYEFTKHDKLQDIFMSYDTSACISCLSYHPIEPSIISAGLFNGDVILWNLILNQSTMPINIFTHSDTVTSLMWRLQTINDPTLLITSSSDGYIIFHKLYANFTNSETYRRFKIIKEHNPIENSRPRSAGGLRERAIEVGLSITCLDFSLKNPTIFIVGTLCGGLYKCSTEAILQVQGDNSLIDPVIDEYDRCDGSVTCVKCSSINNVFVSSNTSKEIRVFDLSEPTCLRVINVEYTIVGMQWVIGNQNIVLVHGADSVVKCFNVSNESDSPKFQIECSMIDSGRLDIHKKGDIVAIADSQNNLEVWKIPKTIE